MMKQKPNHNNEHGAPSNDSMKDWKTMNALIEEIMSESGALPVEELWPYEPAMNPAAHQKIRAFLAKTQTSAGHPFAAGTHSRVETWLAGKPQPRGFAKTDWFAQLEQAWSHAKQSYETMRQACQTMQNGMPSHGGAFALDEALAHLLANRQLAPAVRNAQSTRDYVYPPRRRAIQPADLPIFNPLFCAAIGRDQKTTLLHGLQPNAAFTLTLIQADDPNRQAAIPVKSNPAGGVEIDWASVWAALPNAEQGAVWFLERSLVEGESHAAQSSSREWTSGLVWRQPPYETFPTVEEDSQSQNYSPSVLELLQINRDLSEGHWINAYERIRAQLMLGKSSDDSHGFYPAALWKLADQCIRAMRRRLQPAQFAFESKRPEWQALQALDRLRRQIAERE